MAESEDQTGHSSETRGTVANTLNRIWQNVSWLVIEKFFRLSIGFYVSILVAKSLGPEDFGILNYVLAVVTVFTAISTVGLNVSSVRDFTQMKYPEGSIIASSFLVLLITSSTAFFALSSYSTYVYGENHKVGVAMLLASFLLFIRTSDVARYWFESQVMSKYTVISELTSFMLLAFGRIYLVHINAHLHLFVLALVVEALFAALLLLNFLRREVANTSELSFDREYIKYILRDMLPLTISASAVIIYMKIDQIMVAQILGNESLGIYSVAVRFSEVWYFIPIAIANSFKPTILALHLESKESFKDALTILYRRLSLITIIIALIISVFSAQIILYTYGPEFQDASSVLAVYAFAGVFVSINFASWIWHSAEGGLQGASVRVVVGLTINLVLNAVMIPIYGMLGAAIATLVSRAFASVIIQACIKSSRENFYLIVDSFFLLRR